MDRDEYRRRTKALRHAFAMVARARQALKRIRQLHDAHGTAPESDVLLLLGLSGAGKSAIARHYKDLHPPYTVETDDEIITCYPVLAVEVPVNCSLKALAGSILAALGDVAPTRGNQVEWTRRAVGKLRKHRVEVIILSEFDHLINSNTDQVIEDTAEYLKSLLNENASQFLLVGQPKGIRILRPDGQTERRGQGVIFVEPYDWRVEQDRSEFRIVLNELEKALELPQPSRLGSYDISLRIYNFSGGLPGHATRLLTKALWIAMDEGLPFLSAPLLARAAEELRNPNQRRWFNPFLDGAPSKPAAPATLWAEEEGKLVDMAEARRKRQAKRPTREDVDDRF
jgi:hypothetical protein